jgi:hypothetical protein
MVAPARASLTGFSHCTMRRAILWNLGSLRPGEWIELGRQGTERGR